MSTSLGCQLSVVLPVFNEEGNLRELYQRLSKVLRDNLNLTVYEIIFVDDFSRDGSWKIIEELNQKDPLVRGIKFSRNFGHHIALSAGINSSRGDAVVMMDSDLQDLPEEIPKLYGMFSRGYDVVYGIRKVKKYNVFKKETSRIFNWLMNSIIDADVKINSNIFRIMSRRVIEVFNQYKERDRNITGLISYAGFKEIGVEVEHGARFSGKTKYSLTKMLRLAMNSLTAFSIRPLQLASWVGFILSFFGFISIIYLIIAKIFFGMGILGWTSLLVVIIFIGGIQMLFLGLLGEYIGRIFLEVKGRPLYVVEKYLE
ncbi:MAG: glycosyltransferase family 2 protein [Candidatus Omnitrophica bacterium]|nr:glycosyltransferase family 2 protein [Candidatus Omnitrophota bacterium]